MDGMARWSKTQAATNTMSRRLCKKLRLVMSPLLTTKLRGDYRAGKCTNMIRVIRFIASGYRKDKIRMRRTKPAKRNYRVLLAVENSKSMQKSNAGEMALAVLSTLANGRALKIGEIGIASFRGEMKVIHPFKKPFTNESGMELAGNLLFDKTRTRTALCVDSAMTMLEDSGSAANLKLFFIITDGKIERDSRSKLRKFVRELTEKFCFGHGHRAGRYRCQEKG